LAVSFSRIRVKGYWTGKFVAAVSSRLEDTFEIELARVVLAALEL
jgi:hypothetical protein